MFFARFSTVIRTVFSFFSSTQTVLEIAAIVLIFTGSLLLISSQGIGLTHDSGIYVLSAETLWNKGLMLDHTGQVMKLYPPLYVWLLSVYHYTFLNLYQWAAYLNALAYTLVVYFTFLMARLWFYPSKAIGLSSLWVLLSVPLFINAYFLWSEILFIALASIILYLAVLYIRNPDRYWILTVFSMLSALAVMQRYVGVFLVAAVFFFLLINLVNSYGKAKAFFLSGMYVLPSLSFFLTWMYRNYLLTGRTNSYDEWFLVGPVSNLQEALISIATFFIPDELPTWMLLVFSVLLMITVCYTVLNDRWMFRPAGYLLLLFCLCYLLFFVALNSIVYIGSLDDRYMSPLYAPLTLLIVQAGLYFMHRFNGSYVARYSIYGLLGLITIYLTLRFVKNADSWLKSGRGYQENSWKNNEVVDYLDRQNEKTIILSNNPMPFVLLNGQESYVPVKPLSAYGKTSRMLYVKWKADKAIHYLEMHTDLSDHKKYRLTCIRRFPDADIFSIEALNIKDRIPGKE